MWLYVGVGVVVGLDFVDELVEIVVKFIVLLIVFGVSDVLMI